MVGLAYPFLTVSITVLLLVTGIGASHQNAYTPYIANISVIAMILAVMFNKIRPYQYQFILWTIGAVVLLQNTMLGSSVVGSDIHRELFCSARAITQGWDTQYLQEQSNVSPLVGAVIPLLSVVTRIPPVFIYKTILPMIFAVTPCILFTVYKKMLSPKLAFFSALFFIIMPVFSMEIGQIGKSMVAEVFLALAIYVMVSEWKHKVIWTSLFVLCASAAHYTIGVVAFIYLAGILIIRLITSRWGIMQSKNVSIIGIATILAVTIIPSYLYYSYAGGGVITETVSHSSGSYAQIVSETIAPDTGGNVIKGTDVSEGYFDKQPPLIQTALGMDFDKESLLGKLFRLVQYATQALIILGAGYILFNYKKFNFTAEFLAGIAVAFGLLFLCILVLDFSQLLNATRFYHLSLFWIAPCFSIGCTYIFPLKIFRKRSAFLGALSIVYFIFTSGIVYELTQSNVMNRIEVPYSFALGGVRTGLVGVYTLDDTECAKWLQVQTLPVASDINGFQLLTEYIDKYPRLKEHFLGDYRYNLDRLPKQGYLFLTTWNTINKKRVEGGSLEAGLREVFDWGKLDYPIAFRSGDSVVYQIE